MVPSSIPFTLFYFPNSARRVSPGFLSICFILLFAGISHGDVIKKNGKFDIPYGSLLNNRREEYRQLVETHSIFRSLHRIEFNIDKSIVNFMLDHPPFLAVALKVMKIRNYTVEKSIGGGYLVDDLKGVSGNIEVIYSRPGQKYFYGVGRYKGALIRLTGRGLILFEYLGGAGRPYRTNISYNTYTKIDNMAWEILMKILKPILIPLMDKKVNKFIRETQNLANEITVHPEKVYQAIKESGLAKEAELEEFRKLVF